MNKKIVRDVFWVCLLFLFFSALAALLSSCGAPSPTAFDPNISAVKSELTAEAAQDQARLYSVMATGTAQAPIIAITQTAAAVSIGMTQYSIDRTSTAILWTPTNTPVPTITPSPTSNATQTLQQAAVVATTTAIYQKTQRDEMVNTIKAILFYALILIASLIAVMYAYVHLRRLSFVPVPVDERGRFHPITNVVDAIAYDPEKMVNGMISIREKFIKSLPLITAERQDRVTHLSQITDLATRRALPKQLLDNITQPAGLLPASIDVETNFLLPAWELINSWDGKGIPYYTARGLEVIDTNRFPHLAAVGATGTGKSRRFFRPMIACVLAAGHRVVIIGKSTDYWPFEAHPNASLLTVNKITERGQAERYAKILEAIVTEMNRRDDVLTSAHKSTWSEMGRSLTYIVLDELGNALRLMDKDTSNQSRIWVEGLVSEGRKFGFNIVISNQRATGMSSILSQTGKAIFRVETDEERAHRSLAGASLLHEGYFLAKFGVPKLAGGFEPTDPEIQQFLVSRPVDKIEDRDEWIDAIVADAPARLPEQEIPKITEVAAALDDTDQKIIDKYIEGKSKNQIQMEVFGKAGGNYYNRVSRLIERYTTAQSSNTTNNNTPGTAKIGPIPA